MTVTTETTRLLSKYNAPDSGATITEIETEQTAETTALLNKLPDVPDPGAIIVDQIEAVVKSSPYSRRLIQLSWFATAKSVLTCAFNLILSLVIKESQYAKQLNQPMRDCIDTMFKLSTLHGLGIILNSSRFFAHNTGFWHLIRLGIDALVGVYSVDVSAKGMEALQLGTGCLGSQTSGSNCQDFAKSLGVPMQLGLVFGILGGATHLGFAARSVHKVAKHGIMNAK